MWYNMDTYKDAKFALYKDFCFAYTKLTNNSDDVQKKEFAGIAYAVSLTMSNENYFLSFLNLVKSVESSSDETKKEQHFKECLSFMFEEMQNSPMD